MNTPIDERRLRAAWVLGWVGTLGLPLGAGLLLGFWTAEAGVPWIPGALEALLAVLATSILALFASLRLERRHRDPIHGRPRRRTLVFLVVALILGGGYLASELSRAPSRLTSLSPADRADAFALDLDHYREWSSGLDREVSRLAGGPVFASEHVLSPDEETLLLALWSGVLERTARLDDLRLFWEDWYRFDAARAQRPELLRAFLLSFAAELSLFEAGTRLTAAVRQNKNARKFLDTPHEGLPEFTYSRYSEAIEGMKDQARVLGGAQYLALMERLNWFPEVRALGLTSLWTDCSDRVDALADRGLIDRAAMTLAGDAQALRRTVQRAWLPAQKEVAEVFGDTKFRRIGWYLITPEQVAEMDPELEPGDLLTTRKNWYLSNVGLPGWWPHGILYLGAPTKLAAWADHPDVAALITELNGAPIPFDAYMAKRFPHWWLRYQLGDDGHPYRLLEAYNPGVVLTTLEHSAGDSLAALRPKLDRRAKAQAIIEAFRHLGKPYDFDFDFATDHALVCTEVLFRAYRPAVGKEGLHLPTLDLAGRQTLSANEIVRRFAEEDGAGGQLEFVLFYDADERAQLSRRSTLEAFLDSHERGILHR